MSHDTTITLEFSFKGNTYKPSLSIDLEKWMRDGGNPDQLHHLLAESIGFGPYSHEYAVLMMSEIEFSSDDEWVEQFIDQGRLDLNACKAAWHEQQESNAVIRIAEKHLSSDQLKDPAIRQALIACYRSGQQKPQKKIMAEDFFL